MSSHPVTMAELQDILLEHEARFWDITDNEQDYTRHTLLHLAKLVGKVGNVAEPREHGLEPEEALEILRSQVIPDLLYFALGLAHAHGVDLASAFRNRMQQNAVKIEHRRMGILEKSSL